VIIYTVAHSTSYPMGNGGSFPGDQQLRPSPSSAKAKMHGAIPSFPHTSSWGGLN